jgi:RNA polymerase sigma-70 factor (ECF subfamily)
LHDINSHRAATDWYGFRVVSAPFKPNFCVERCPMTAHEATLNTHQPNEAAALTAKAAEMHERVLFAIAYKILRNADDAADLVNSTLLKYYEVLLAGKVIKNPKAWLAKVARHLAISHRRRMKTSRQVPLADDGLQCTADHRRTDPSEVAVCAELADQLRLAVARLPARQQSILTLRMEGFKLHEIGKMHDGMPTSTVHFLLKDAIEKLRSSLTHGGA